MHNIYTHHSKVRFRQRGISEEVVECIEKYGENFTGPGNATKIKIPHRKKNQIIQELKKAIRIFENTEGIVLVEKDGIIITGYHNN